MSEQIESRETAYQDTQFAEVRPFYCTYGCGLLAAPDDIFCLVCRSGHDQRELYDNEFVTN